MKRTVLIVVLGAAVAASLIWLRMLTAPLSAIVRGGYGPPAVVLLHGYGSRAEDWLQFDDHWQFPASTKRIYPQAPLRGPWSGGRGWWWLNLEGHVPEGEQFADYTREDPGGLTVAAKLVRDLIAGEREPIVLGGFSQGAMVGGEIAFQTNQELAGLILLSGTPVNEEAWAEHFAGRRHLPIFIAHGRSDGVLSFAKMDRFQARLKAFGLNVTWLPFDGGHEIPVEVVAGVNAFVRNIFLRDQPF